MFCLFSFCSKFSTLTLCHTAFLKKNVVCGLPEPCEDHAIVMARFSRECLSRMQLLTRQLEAKLGPDTALLNMRAGLNSGPVTAGVLRGERARFQLFGDTVNTAARMESTGVKKKIHMSRETAELIMARHPDWVRQREDTVVAKGKGEMQTYWLLPSKKKHEVSSGNNDDLSENLEVSHSSIYTKATAQASSRGERSSDQVMEERTERMVKYVSDILLQSLKKIVAKRRNQKLSAAAEKKLVALEDSIGKTGICLDEVEEIIELPCFDQAAYNTQEAKVDQKVADQLVSLVRLMAKCYHFNPFHNFEHASHVTQSTAKLLSRIVAAKKMDEAEELHDNTYGITSDPLTHFAVVFAALIHDVDHRGSF